MKKLILPLLLVGLTSTICGQAYKSKLDSLWTARSIKRGERLFDNMRYLNTSNLYAPIFQKGVLNDKSKGMLAQSYLNIASYKKALDVLRAMDSTAMLPADVYNMAQCLKLNGSYNESDAWIAKYERLKSDDSRPKWQSNSAAEVGKIMGKERYAVFNVPFNSSQSDFAAFATGNDVVFASARKIDELVAREYGWKMTPYLNVFKVTVMDSAYSQPQIFSSKLKTVYHDGPVCFSADGGEMYVTQNPHKFFGKVGKKQINQFQLLKAQKQADGSWGGLVKLPFNGDGFSTGHAALSANGQILWFASDRPGGMGRSDIYYAQRNGDTWGEPVNAGSDINTEGDEMFPFEANDGKLYFSSNGHLTLGGLDVCLAFKTASGYTVRNMGNPINTSSDDFALCMRPDNMGGFFASNRSGGNGDDDIYRFSVLDPIVLNRQLEVRVLDKATLKPIKNADLKFATAGKNLTVKTDTAGLAVMTVEEDDKVTASADVMGYKPNSQIFPIVSDVNKGELLLEMIPVWGVYGTVTDLATGMGIDSIQVLIQKAGQSLSIGNLTLNGGTFKNEIEPETDYVVSLSSPLYFTRKGSFTTKGLAPGWININEFMEASVEKIEVNKVIEIPNIYYDLGKWNIRKDAAVELDKVVAFMNDNPTIVIELGSHTDSRGSAVSNQSLSQKRAQSAVDYIVKKGGVAVSRISAKGYGESLLKNSCADGVTCSEQEHQQNRRTEIRVVGMK